MASFCQEFFYLGNRPQNMQTAVVGINLPVRARASAFRTYAVSLDWPLSGAHLKKRTGNVKQKESRDTRAAGKRQRAGKKGERGGRDRRISFSSFSPAHREIGQTQSACTVGLLRCISRKLKKPRAQEITKINETC